MKSRTLYCFGITLLCAAVGLGASAGSPPLTVHEWGTFTSVQGGNGTQLIWYAGQADELPPFVYNWSKPGLDRSLPIRFYLNKVGMQARQRMETPVIYFYSDEKLTADVTVKFPSGLITEWFPQAAKIGPAIAHADLEAGKPTNPFADYESLITWRNIEVLPAERHPRVALRMPVDSRGTHYYAARETDAAFVRVNNLSSTNNADEFDKLLFYRGAGNFVAPLTVMTTMDGLVTVTNTGRQALNDLFLLQVRSNGDGALTHLSALNPGSQHDLGTLEPTATRWHSRADLRREVGRQMEAALVNAGLFPREAAAMVKTWSDLWFAEEGARVLYLLPHGWTDEILPLEVSPAPQKLVRVMVGRAEVIPPALVRDLSLTLERYESGGKTDEALASEIAAYAKRLGRFNPAAVQLANELRVEEKNKRVATLARP